MPSAVIHIKDLHFSRAGREIFSGINMEIKPAKITAIMGPSGCGKTTLLRLIGAQLRPSQGKVYVEGQDIHQQSHQNLYAMRKRMGMLFQSGALLSDLSVFENIAFPIREHYNFPESIIKTLVLMKLELVGLRGTVKLMPTELSGGMSRRIALARAIALDPILMMYDEPFVGLDPITMGVAVRLIKELHEALGMSSIVVSHDIHEVLSIADDINLIADGKVVAAGSTEEIQHSNSDWVQQFIHGKADGAVPFHYPSKLSYQTELMQTHSSNTENPLC
jgi:phospholipid/cholesterol/gamma-HCH transport system ATP-binding protein